MPFHVKRLRYRRRFSVRPPRSIAFSPQRPESHLLRRTACTSFPFEEHRSIGLCDVDLARNTQCACGSVDPTRRAFDLPNVSNRSLIYNHMSLSVAPLRPVFFITEHWLKTEGAENFIHLLAV